MRELAPSLADAPLKFDGWSAYDEVNISALVVCGENLIKIWWRNAESEVTG